MTLRVSVKNPTPVSGHSLIPVAGSTFNTHLVKGATSLTKATGAGVTLASRGISNEFHTNVSGLKKYFEFDFKALASEIQMSATTASADVDIKTDGLHMPDVQPSRAGTGLLLPHR
jgi:hypothetical protein